MPPPSSSQIKAGSVVHFAPAIYTLQKPVTGVAGLKTLVSKVSGATWMALELESVSDADKVSRELRNFIGKDLKAVTVVLVK